MFLTSDNLKTTYMKTAPEDHVIQMNIGQYEDKAENGNGP